MRLLLDQNLSPKLMSALSDLFPGSQHVRDVGLESATDEKVWMYAIKFGLTIVSKDSDFFDRSMLLGHPPKVVCVKIGNCSTARLLALIKTRAEELKLFQDDKDSSFFVLE